MLFQKGLILPSIIFLFMACTSAPASQPVAASVQKDTVQQFKSTNNPTRKHVSLLTQIEIIQRASTNPCYLPLVASSNSWQPNYQKGFLYKDLINTSLPKGHFYANRYLVGDFNVVDKNGRNKGVEEVYPALAALSEFASLPSELRQMMDTIRFGTDAYDRLRAAIASQMGDKAAGYLNFLEKVWKYRMVPIKREYSILNENIYYAGQSLVMCEACEDTLLMKGKFATSAKGRNSPSKNGYSGNFPVRKRRAYYAGMNLISSRNWERRRKYDSLDMKRDRELGGGKKHVTYFKGKVELPNFLLIDPGGEYPGAMHSNGIHEVALRELARGMLGTANSLGCLRVSDFGSKFLRWWVPQNTRLFITYEDDKYHRRAGAEITLDDLLPFKTAEQGNAFRKWINQYKPLEAKILEIKETGDHKNGYILDGYYYFKDEYADYQRQQKSGTQTGENIDR